MKTLSATFTQEVPNLSASDASQYPIVSGDADASPIAATTPLKSYAVIPTPTWGRTSSFTIHSAAIPSLETPLYHVAITRGLSTTSSIHIQEVSDAKPILATCRIKGLALHKYLLLGPYPDCTDLADWTRIRASSKLDPSKHHFAFQGDEYSWTRTRKAEYGVNKWLGKSFKLVRVINGEVLGVYVHKAQWKRRDEGRVDWFGEMDKDLKVLSLAAIMGIQEELRRQEG